MASLDMMKRTNPAPPSTIMFVVGCVLVMIASIYRETTWLQTAIGFIGMLLSILLGEILFFIVFLSLTVSITFWICKKHLTDWVVVLLMMMWIGYTLWSLIVGGVRGVRGFFSVFVYTCFSLIIIRPLIPSERDRAKMFLVTAWLGTFLWVYSLAPNHYGF